MYDRGCDVSFILAATASREYADTVIEPSMVYTVWDAVVDGETGLRVSSALCLPS